MEENWTFSNLADSLQTVRKELEVLRGEHESLISGVKNNVEPGENVPQDKDDDNGNECEDNEALLLQESKEAVLAESLNRLNGGVQESELLAVLVQYLSSLEGDKKKLKAQVKRLADENNWLRQQLQRTQQLLQDAETEACRVKEEKQHLEYTISLSARTSEVSLISDVESSTTQDTLQTDNSAMGLSASESLVRQEESDECVSSELGVGSNLEKYSKLHQLAVQHLQQGRHDVALSLCKKAIRDIEVKHGPINSDRGDMMNVMVVIHREQGRLKEAVEVLQEVLEIREKLNGRDNQTVAATLNNLSVLRGKLGEFKLAESTCRRALEIRQKLLGNSHPDVAQQLVNLAALCQHLGKYEEVEWYYQRAIEIYQGEFGPDDENVIKTLNFLGKCYMKQGNLEAAEKVFKKVRSSVQLQDGRESREQSNSPTLLMRTETPEKSSLPPQPLKIQCDTAIQRRGSEMSFGAGINSALKQKGRSSVSENVRKLFKWGQQPGGGGGDTM